MIDKKKHWKISRGLHVATSSWGGSRKPPYAFTENGIAMLSSIFRNETVQSILFDGQIFDKEEIKISPK